MNFSVSQDGREFSQHVHDYSDDTILILQGQADLRQGDSRTPLHAGQCAFVPSGQIHGTITTGAGDTIMISFQVPPDLVLYTLAIAHAKPLIRGLGWWAMAIETDEYSGGDPRAH